MGLLWGISFAEYQSLINIPPLRTIGQSMVGTLQYGSKTELGCSEEDCIWWNSHHFLSRAHILVTTAMEGHHSKCSLTHFHWSASAYNAVTTVIKSTFEMGWEDNFDWIFGSREIKSVNSFLSVLYWITYKQSKEKIVKKTKE